MTPRIPTPASTPSRMKTDRRTSLGIVAAALVLAAPPLAAQDWQTLAVSRRQVDESQLEAKVSHAAGTLRFKPADGALLYSMDLRYDAENFDPVVDFAGAELALGVEGIGRDLRIKGDRGAADMEVALSSRVPLDLELEFGAGRAEVELGGLRLTDLVIRTGASESRIEVSHPNPIRLSHATFSAGAAQLEASGLANLNAERISVDAGVGAVVLDFSGEWRGDLGVEVEMGLASLELRIPRGVGVKLVKESFLTDLDASDLSRDGDAWYSSDWSSAEYHVTLDIRAGFGSIEVHWIE